MAESTTIYLTNVVLFKQQALHWANYFEIVCLLDSNNYGQDKYHAREWVLAIDALTACKTSGQTFEQLKEFHTRNRAELFGFISYDVKNELEQLTSRNEDRIGFPDAYFFQPRYVLEIKGNRLTVNRNYPETFELLELISKIPVEDIAADNRSHIPSLCARTEKEEYIEKVNAIRKQIEEGDFYELNYCNEFYGVDVRLSPVAVFLRLNQIAQAPFSSFVKWHQSYLLCASPERFLKKEGQRLVAQPIKGTNRRGATPEENEMLMAQLHADEKERAENVMIVDLVRNDLARSAKAGSVAVEELFGVYAFNTVNQMISTVTAELGADCHWTEALKNAFPMGSMTGAPKVIVLQQIDAYENFRRGLYSGSVGYVSAAGDFDFNVVIRSILYHAPSGYFSVPVGGAITYDSVPEKEYEETLLKAAAMQQALGQVSAKGECECSGM